MVASTAVPAGYTITPDLRLYGSSGFLDFYVNDYRLNWGVELMCEGRKKSEHVARFTQTVTAPYKAYPKRWGYPDPASSPRLISVGHRHCKQAYQPLVEYIEGQSKEAWYKGQRHGIMAFGEIMAFGQRHNDRGTYANPVAAYTLDATTPPTTVSP